MSSRSIKIRPVRDDLDLGQWLGVRAELDRNDRVDLEEATYYPRHLQDHYDLIAWAGDEPVGAAAALLSSSFPRPFARVYVLPPAQRRGVGTVLYGALSRWAAGRGHQALEVWIEDEH